LEEDNILLFWDHVPRMPWQTEDYYRNQHVQLRPAAYDRMHCNMWLESAEQFITQEMWDVSCRGEAQQTKSTYALDGSKNSDCTALVGAVRQNDIVRTTDVHIWRPERGEEVNQDEVMKVILDLHGRKLIRLPLYYDPYQLVKLAQDLRAKGIRCQEFSQAGERTRADVSLYKLYKEGKIINFPHQELRQHVLAAAVKYYGDDELRIVKPNVGEENERKVDAAVAQSMAAYKACTVSGSGGWATSGSKIEEE
jgi:phage terminase large subunit-like protein